MVTLVCAALGTLALSVSHRADWAECVHACVQEAGSQLPLRHRTHSTERAPDDLLSPKSLIKEAQAAMLLEAPAQNPFSPLSQACKQPSGHARHRRCICHSSMHHRTALAVLLYSIDRPKGTINWICFSVWHTGEGKPVGSAPLASVAMVAVPPVQV